MKKKLIFIPLMSILLLYVLLGCKKNPLIGNTYVGKDGIWEKTYSITFYSSNFCLFKVNDISTKGKYKITKTENKDSFSSLKYEGIIYNNFDDKEFIFHCSEDGNLCSISSQYTNAMLEKQN